jgi:hypothetical protein
LKRRPMTLPDRSQAIEKSSCPTFQLFTRAWKGGEEGTRAGPRGEGLVNSSEELNWYISQSLTPVRTPPLFSTLQADPRRERP